MEDIIIRFHLVGVGGGYIDAPDNGLFEKLMTTEDSINAITVENLAKDGRYTVINWNNVKYAERIEENKYVQTD